MSQLQLLRAASTLHEVASLLQFQAKALAYVVYKKPASEKYHSFDICKRNGGLRRINAPCAELKLLQQRLSDLLQNCVSEINATKALPDQLAHGFKRDRSIVTNALRHQKRRYVFNLDLENFFPTLNFGRVRGFFIKDANFMLDAKVATILAQIACHDNGLPQGSPCSPVISNLIAHVLDVHLCRLASKEGCMYSRYADDITFSTNKKAFPLPIAMRVAGGPHDWTVGSKVQEIITHAGFAINPRKTRMQYDESRQEVTGLVVNKKVNIRSDYRRRVRAMAQSVFMTGQFHFIKTVPDSNGVFVPSKVAGHLNQLNGMIGHIDFVDRHNEEMEAKRDAGSAKAKQSAKAALYSKRKLYRRFLMFKDFYVTDRPLIVCEGKTDNVYLDCAIKNLAASYPKLASLSPKLQLNVRILRTVDSSVGRVLHLGHGWSDLDRVVGEYLQELSRLKAPGMQQPVILLVDNDDAADQICKTIKRLTKKNASRAVDPFVHIAGNLYLVITPPVRSAPKSEIEDCFDATIRNLNLGGKTFSSDSKADPARYFSKSILAQYVRENAAKMDFTGFAPLLQRLVDAIGHYESMRTAPAAGVAAAGNS